MSNKRIVIKEEKMNYKKSPDVFFRKYNDKTILYQTSISKVHIMSEACYEVLKYFDIKNTMSIYKYRSSIYQIEENDCKNEIDCFLNELVDIGVLIEDVHGQNASELEAKIFEDGTVPKGTLYSCMFELTYRCNERCKHCYCVSDDAKGELTKEEIFDLLNQLKEMNTFEVVFTGGDLFVRKDAFEMLEYANSLGFLIRIFTNGIALKEDDFYRLKRIYPKSISFSLYDTIAEKHDEFTTVKGSFETTVAAAKKCRALGIPVTIKSNVTQDNKDRLEDLIEFVKNIDASIELTVSITPRNDGDTSPTDFRPNGINEYEKIFKEINKHLEDGEKQTQAIPPAQDRKLCWAGEKGISINPYGKVYACNALLVEIGDIKNQKIKDIWENSSELKKIRSYRTSDLIGCDDCSEKQFCSFCMGNALNEEGNLLTKYSEACNITKAQMMLRKE